MRSSLQALSIQEHPQNYGCKNQYKYGLDFLLLILQIGAVIRRFSQQSAPARCILTFTCHAESPAGSVLF
jgi:hypothetical protein